MKHGRKEYGTKGIQNDSSRDAGSADETRRSRMAYHNLLVPMGSRQRKSYKESVKRSKVQLILISRSALKGLNDIANFILVAQEKCKKYL